MSALEALVRVAAVQHGGPLAIMLEFATNGREVEALEYARQHGEHVSVIAALEDLVAVQRVVRQTNESELGKKLTAQTAALKSAIRAYTVDAKNEAGEDIANGPAEEAMLALDAVILRTAEDLRRGGDPKNADELLELAARAREADALQVRALREAANAYFGEDFSR